MSFTFATLSQAKPTVTYHIDTTEDVEPFTNVSVTSKLDPLVLSCTLKRLRTSNATVKGVPASVLSFQNDIDAIADLYSPEDTELADHVKKHFVHKFIMMGLHGQPLSKFKQDVYTFINADYKVSDDQYTFPGSFIGLVYRLPDFYEYDVKLAKVFGSTEVALNGGMNMYNGPKTLTFLDKLVPSLKKKKVFEYWFSDEHDNRVMITMQQNDPLIAMWEKNIQAEPVTVHGMYKAEVRFTSCKYYKLGGNWKVVNDQQD